MSSETERAKAKKSLEQLLAEVRDAAERWEENARYAGFRGYYIDAQLAHERADMLNWVLEEADRGMGEKSCKGCVHEPNLTIDEENIVWGSDDECETCIRMIGIPKDNYKPRLLEVEKS